MFDFLGPYSFARITGPARQVGRQFRVVSHGGVEGVTVWDLGRRGDPFQVQCLVYGYSLAQAREFYREVSSLEDGDPVQLYIAGESEPNTVYQVLRVEPIACKRILYGRGPGGPFYAKLLLNVTLLPITEP